jgi:apolipoprotein N-acyltransferase
MNAQSFRSAGHGRFWASGSLAALAGGAYAAAQPDRGVWWLAPLCLVPLLLCLRERPALGRLALGWLCGTVAGTALVLAPITHAVSGYFGIDSLAAGLVAFCMAQVFGALPLALFALIIGDPKAVPGWQLSCRCAASLVAVEYARSTLPTGLPWGLLGHTMTPVPELVGSAALGGALLVSFLLAALNGCAASLVERPSAATTWAAASLIVAALAAPGLLSSHSGAIRLLEPSDGVSRAEAGDLQVSLVHSHRLAASRRDPTGLRGELGALAALSGGPGVDLAVWPENAIVAMLPANAGMVTSASTQAGAARSTLFGAPRSEGKEPGSPYNSAFLVEAGGEPRAVHDKVRLVPFAESTPEALRGRLGDSANRAGGAFESFELAGAGGKPTKLGVLICYESIFAEATRELALGGAEVLVNISNDEWFGGIRGAEQLFASSVMRAVETKRPMLRASNAGVTAAIGPDGRVAGRLSSRESGSLLLAVRPGSEITLFVRYGQWVAWLSILFLLLDLGIARRAG